MCCGEKRTTVRRVSRSAAAGLAGLPGPSSTPPSSSGVSGADRPEAAPYSGGSSVQLRYLRSAPVKMQGVVSGRQYEFAMVGEIQAVDRRDVPGLMRTGFFRQM